MKNIEETYQHQMELLKNFREKDSYRKLEFEGWSWTYWISGQGSRTILLLPGAFVGIDMWFYLITALQDRYRLLALDMPSKTLTLPETMDAIIRLLDVEGINKTIVLGYSAGGGLAQAFMQAHPQRVDHLILSHCTTLSSESATRIRRMLRLIRLLPMPLIRAIFARRSSAYPTSSEWASFTRTFFAERIQRLEKSTLLRFLEFGTEASHTFQFDPDTLRAWSGEILLLSSGDDATTFQHLWQLKERYPIAKTHVFEQGGHHTIFLFPEIYVSVLVNFLENL